MSSQEMSQRTKRRRRSAPPPARLGWPGGMTQQTTSSTQPSTATTLSSQKNKHKSKRQRTLLSAFNNNNDLEKGDDSPSSLLWTEKYAPTGRKDLCVAPKKIQEAAEWLEDDSSPEHLLILVGRPGIGKSAMMRVLAEEANVELLEWSETYSTWSQHVESMSPLNSFAQFLHQSGAGFSSLDLQLTTGPSSSSLSTIPSTELLPQKRLIVLEELPNLANAESQERFRELFTNHVQGSHVKTVWIYSDVTEGNHKPQDLERHVDPSVLYSPHAKILQINPATKAQLRKALERIAKAEGFSVSKDFCERMHLQSGGDVRYAIMALQFDQAGQQNDSRKATKKAKKSFFAPKSKGNSQSPALREASRDTQWTAFHALGKILYAKREPPANNDNVDNNNSPRERPPLQFDPEQVLEHCDLDLGNALTYLGYHSVDFFTDMEEISTVFDLYSDASYLLEQTTNFNYQRQRWGFTNSTTISCPIFPEGYVTSLASRSVAYANHHPAPSRFRQLNAPKVLEIRRKRTDNAHQLHRLQQRLSMLSMADVVQGTGSSGLSPFVMDRLPFLRIIAPQAVTASLDRLHSSSSEHTVRFRDVQKEEEDAALARLQEEQQAILQLDDIEDFDNSDEENVEEATTTIAVAPATRIQNNPLGQGSSVMGGGTRQNNGISGNGVNGKKPATAQPAKQPSKPVFNPYKKKPSNGKTAPIALSQRKAPPQVSWSRSSKPPAKLVNPYANPMKPSKPVATVANPPPEPSSTEQGATKQKENGGKVVLMDV